jgi:hypothetical protein
VPKRLASTADPETWSTFALAAEAAERAGLHGQWGGIGFAIKDSPFGCVDLDDCVGEGGEIAPWAWDIVMRAEAAGCYVEISVSGDGVHLWGRSSGREVHTKFSREGGVIEIFRSCRRYVTISGRQISEGDELGNIDALIDELLPEHEKPKGKPRRDNGSKPRRDDDDPDNTPSGIFHERVCKLTERGWSVERIEADYYKHPAEWKDSAGKRYESDGRNGGLLGEIERSAGKARKPPKAGELFDPWAEYVVPAFPLDVLPPSAQSFVSAQSVVMGCDASALAMATLAAFSGAIDHRVKLKMMRHGDWHESSRLWVLLVGPPSAKKTPIFNTATAPLERYQNYLRKEHEREVQQCKARKEEPPPPPARYVVWDTTIEKLGELMARYSKGLLVKRDEIAGWVGQMEKYGGGGGGSSRGASTDRAFWLQAWDGKPYGVDRIGRGEIPIENLSASLLGGIQTKRLAELHGLTSDGLLQRFLPMIVGPAKLPQDRKSDSTQYQQLVRDLIRIRPATLTMTDDALELMSELRSYLHELGLASEGLADGFQTFVGKLDGYAGSLALILHLASDPHNGSECSIEWTTVEKVRRLIVDFILPHAFEFYRTAESVTDGDRLKRIASYLLTCGQDELSARDLTRHVGCLRGLSLFDLNKQMSPLVAAGWLEPEELSPVNRTWHVHDAVAEQFAEQKEREESRKQKLAELMGSPRKSQSAGE